MASSSSAEDRISNSTFHVTLHISVTFSPTLRTLKEQTPQGQHNFPAGRPEAMQDRRLTAFLQVIIHAP